MRRRCALTMPDYVYLRTEIRRKVSAYSNGKSSAFILRRSLIRSSISEPRTRPGIWLLCWARASIWTSIPLDTSTTAFFESAPQNRRWLTLCGSNPSLMCSGKVQVVACVGINRVHDGDSDAAVVPVIESRKPVRVVTQDHVGPVFADRPDHFAQERPVGFQFTVGMIEDHEVFDADHICRRALFGRAYGHYVGGGHRRVVTAAASGRALNVANLASGASPCG